MNNNANVFFLFSKKTGRGCHKIFIFDFFFYSQQYKNNTICLKFIIYKAIANVTRCFVQKHF